MNKASQLLRNTEHKLIESIYGVTIDLDKYSDLLRLWEQEFLQVDVQVQDVSPIVNSHVQNASTILEMTQPLDEVGLPLEQVIKTKQLPTFTLNQNKQICLANDSALKFFNIEIGSKLALSVFSSDDMGKIEACLKQLADVKIGEILTIIQPHDEDGEATLLFALSKLRDVHMAQDYLQISAVNVAWSHDVGAVIQESFSLSDTELDLARRYVAGERLAEIALSKDRAVNTLKAQTKSLYRKTKLNSQSELVRLFSALQSFAIPDIDEITTPPMGIVANNQNNVILQPDGRKLYYEIYGDPKGEPVLFMHDILLGTQMPANVQGYLYAHKIKLIAPHRAGYGHSDAYLKPDRLDNFVADMRQILAAEKVDKFKIIGLYLGSNYAYYLANAMPQQVIKMRLINAYAPVTSKQQMAEIPMPIKVLVYTIKYMPQLFPFLMRIMTAQLKKLGATYVINDYFRGSEFDIKLCQEPEIADIVMNSFHCCFNAGQIGPSQSATDAIEYDWLALMKKCQVKVEYIHAKNSFSPLHMMEEMVQWQKNSSLEVMDGGQLILYKYPEKILKNL